jgi:uncharacterized membrane protein affecting hemolysin expression
MKGFLLVTMDFFVSAVKQQKINNPRKKRTEAISEIQ